jgi:hypothetical protein
MANQQIDLCIVRALSNLGPDTIEVIFYYLRTRYGITPEEASTDPIRLGWALREIFGSATSLVIDLILDEAKSVKSPSEDLIHFAQSLRGYRETFFPEATRRAAKQDKSRS